MQTGHSGQNRLVVIIVTLVVVLGASVAWARSDDGSDASAGDRVPERRVVDWPAAIAPVAARVEALRGLEFRRPVAIRFRDIPTTPGVTGPDDREALRTALEPLAVFGLVDLEADLDGLAGVGGIAGAYSYDDPGIRIFTDPDDPATAAVIAHELTHALEDQHLPSEDRPEPKNHAQAVAQAMVVEGSASLVEQRFLASTFPLSIGAPRRPAADATSLADLRAWEYLGTAAALPYLLGPASLDALLARGERSWDEIVANPPLSDVVFADPLVNPGALWSGTRPQGAPEANPRNILEPSALETYLVLASRIDPATALEVLRRTSSASSGYYENDGRLCGDLTLVTPAGDDPIVAAAVDEWVAAADGHATRTAIPASTTTIVSPSRTPEGSPTSQTIPRAGAQVLGSCVGIPPAELGAFLIPTELLAVRSTAVARALRLGRSPDTAACVAERVLADGTLRSRLRDALDSATGVAPVVVPRAGDWALRACRGRVGPTA